MLWPRFRVRNNTNYIQSFMFDCEVKFLLDTKLIDSKNYDNFEVFCFCCCGYEVVYYYSFENEVFVFEISAEIVFISSCNNEQSK
jgi:hypothetical protein